MLMQTEDDRLCTALFDISVGVKSALAPLDRLEKDVRCALDFERDGDGVRGNAMTGSRSVHAQKSVSQGVLVDERVRADKYPPWSGLLKSAQPPCTSLSA